MQSDLFHPPPLLLPPAALPTTTTALLIRPPAGCCRRHRRRRRRLATASGGSSPPRRTRRAFARPCWTRSGRAAAAARSSRAEEWAEPTSLSSAHGAGSRRQGSRGPCRRAGQLLPSCWASPPSSAFFFCSRWRLPAPPSCVQERRGIIAVRLTADPFSSALWRPQASATLAHCRASSLLPSPRFAGRGRRRGALRPRQRQRRPR